MLEHIRLRRVASYVDVPVADLRTVNFFFGTNGSGKTTISRLVNDAIAPDHADCSLSWTDNRPLETFVYNTEFTEQNFGSQFPGVFTLGDVDRDKVNAIAAARERLGELNNDIATIEARRGSTESGTGELGRLGTLRQEFVKACWQIKADHDGHFQQAFQGVRGSSDKFCDRVLHEQENNNATLKGLDDLKVRAQTVFDNGASSIPRVPTFTADQLSGLVDAPILAKRIIGKDDVDIAALIRRLGNSDWVRSGLSYVHRPGDPCPFCQKPIEEGLLAELNDFFDAAYTADIDTLRELSETFSALANTALEALEAISASANEFLDIEAFRAAAAQLKLLIDLDRSKIVSKQKEPSTSMVLEPLGAAVDAITALIETANEQIRRHNDLVENLAEERVTLTAEIWRHIIDDRKDLIDRYLADKTAIDRAITGLGAGLARKLEQRNEVTQQLTEMEKEVTSVQPTVTEINATLASFGFTSFSLATTGDRQHLYKIVRSDGSDARNSLSEGERSFITFLYFYHLTRGSLSESGTQSDRVVVFDDPVSSLDSDVLFIVSSLVKRVIEDAKNGASRIKQVFVLTHNIYFHKEVTYLPNRNQRDRMADETFWVVRKSNGNSQVVGHPTNPIRTSYELLWAEVRNPERSLVSIQNVLRRILEYYFTILGNQNKDAVIAQFDGRDQMICGSLYSWINDGSHNFADELYLVADEETVMRYLQVFKRIFQVTNHEAHYAMMVGDEDPVPAVGEAANDDRPEDAAEIPTG